MCLGIPGKVVSIDRSSVPLMGTVEFGGIRKNICLDLVPDVAIGMFVIVHVGFALCMMNEEEAEKTLTLFDEIQKSIGSNEE